jgi:hypothetical protein
MALFATSEFFDVSNSKRQKILTWQQCHVRIVPVFFFFFFFIFVISTKFTEISTTYALSKKPHRGQFRGFDERDRSFPRWDGSKWP